MREGSEADIMSFTTVQDLAGIVARAVEFEGEWPTIGGIRGTQLSMNRIVALGEEIRGMLRSQSHIPKCNSTPTNNHHHRRIF